MLCLSVLNGYLELTVAHVHLVLTYNIPGPSYRDILALEWHRPFPPNMICLPKNIIEPVFDKIVDENSLVFDFSTVEMIGTKRNKMQVTLYVPKHGQFIVSMSLKLEVSFCNAMLKFINSVLTDTQIIRIGGLAVDDILRLAPFSLKSDGKICEPCGSPNPIGLGKLGKATAASETLSGGTTITKLNESLVVFDALVQEFLEKLQASARHSDFVESITFAIATNCYNSFITTVFNFLGSLDDTQK